MSLKLDLLLEAINELDNMEANGEVLEESYSGAMKIKSSAKHLKLDRDYNDFIKGNLSKKEGKTVYDKYMTYIDKMNDIIKNDPGDSAVSNLPAVLGKTMAVGLTYFGAAAIGEFITGINMKSFAAMCSGAYSTSELGNMLITKNYTIKHMKKSCNRFEE